MHGWSGDRSTTGGARRNRLALTGLLILVAVLYFSTLSVNHTEAEDSLRYLVGITSRAFREQFHINHLLYQPINYLFFQGWKALGYTGSAEFPVKLINILCALAALGVMWRLGQRVRLPVAVTALCLLGTAFSYGFWWYSVECETYVLPIPFILLSLELLLIIGEDPLPWRHHLFLGLSIAATVLLHQQHILSAGVALAGYGLAMIGARYINWWRVAGRAVLCGAVSALVIGGTYGLVAFAVLGLRSPAEITGWLSGTVSGGYGYGFSLGSLKALIGLGRAFLGGHYVFSFSQLTAWLQRAIPNYELKEELFLVQGFPRSLSLLLLGLTLLFLAFIAFAIAGLIARKWRRATLARPGDALDRRRGRLLWLLASYVVIYALFNVWWLPESVELWISLLPVIWLAAGLLLAQSGPRKHSVALMGVAVTCLFIVNFWGSVLPQLDRNRDYWYAYNAWLIQETGPGDLVVSGAGYVSAGYVAFYSGAEVFVTSWANQDLERDFGLTRLTYQPRRILFSSDILSPRELTNRIWLDVSQARQFFERARPHLSLLHADEWQDIYLYDLGSP